MVTPGVAAFLRRYDNGRGFWNCAGDGEIHAKEMNAGGGPQQMAADFRNLSLADQQTIRTVLGKSDPNVSLDFFHALALQKTLPISEAQDPQMERMAFAAWNEIVDKHYAALRMYSRGVFLGLHAPGTVFHEWIIHFPVRFAPFFTHTDGTVDADAAKAALRRFYDELSLRYDVHFSAIGDDAFTVLLELWSPSRRRPPAATE